jgi:predicted SAM-dependent methyltransferase
MRLRVEPRRKCGGSVPRTSAGRVLSQCLNGSRIAAGVERRVQMLRHRGNEVLCPICGHSFERFKDDWNRPNALCWRCGSHERHRAQWIVLTGPRGLLRGARSLLHFAPEWALRHQLQQVRDLHYVTTDRHMDDVDLQLDVAALDLPDASFDAVLCSHVLEHVEDDRAAMRELARVTAPGGWCLVMVPIDLTRRETYEDATITSPQERVRAFWQHDHVRLYAADIGDRLEDAGFHVERLQPEREFGTEMMRRCRIDEADEIWLCRPRLWTFRR